MSFWTTGIKEKDSAVHQAIVDEFERQQNTIELIASENITSTAVREAQGSVLTNKYAEGYPRDRYYRGCEHVDKVEDLAIERICTLFGCKYANVQPHSGSQANQAVFLSLLKPGDTILGMSIDAGGHLTHGHKVNMSGKWFNAVGYTVDKESFLIDMEDVAKVAEAHKPKLIIAGASAYSRKIDFEGFRKIADSVGAYLLADVAHYSGLIVGGVYPNPFPHAHVVTSTTHKTLRGPRGGIVLTNDEELIKKVNRAIFPGLQGGPLMHVIAGKAVAFGEALTDQFKDYAVAVVENARCLSDVLQKRGYHILTGGTDSHMIILDLRQQGVTGFDAANLLHEAGLTCNRNGVPFDTTSPKITSGIRLGSSACTTRGFGKKEFKEVGNLIADILDVLWKGGDRSAQVEKVSSSVRNLCKRFPIYENERL